MSNHDLAKDILGLVGGNENIVSVVNCATRLRFKLKNESVAKTDEIKNHPGVLQVVQNSGQYQIVIGSHVKDVREELEEIMASLSSHDGAQSEVAASAASAQGGVNDSPKEKVNIVNIFIDTVSGIFTPFISALAGTGFMLGMVNLALFAGILTNDSGVFAILNAAGSAFLHFLPMAIAFTAAKKFKANEFTSLALAMTLMFPGVAEFNELHGGISFLGLPVIYGAGYASSVIPIIFAVYVQSRIEPFMKKISPKPVSLFLPTTLTLLVLVPLTFIAIGPLGTIIGVILGGVFRSIYTFSPLVAGLLLGGFWQVLVIFGIHWGLVPVALTNLGTIGFDFLLPIAVAGVMGQAGASLGVFLKAKKGGRLKGLAGSGTITGFFGITEPTVYGVTLPLKKPFYAGCAAGAIGGAINAVSGVYAFAFSSQPLTIIPNMISQVEGVESNVVMGIVGLATAFVLGTIFTMVYGFEEKE